jgi:hypothetical protein
MFPVRYKLNFYIFLEENQPLTFKVKIVSRLVESLTDSLCLIAWNKFLTVAVGYI